jgi:hypothetical protein
MSGTACQFSPPGCLVRTTPPGRDTSRSSSVFGPAMLSATSTPRIVVQIEIVERATLQRRLLPLHRHHQIGDQAAECLASPPAGETVREPSRGRRLTLSQSAHLLMTLRR